MDGCIIDERYEFSNLLLNPDPGFRETFCISVSTVCEEVSLSPQLYEKYRIVNIDHYKERNRVGHEFLIIDIFDGDLQHPTFRLCAERRPSRRKADPDKPAPKPLIDFLVSPSDDTISRVRRTFKPDNFDHLANLRLHLPAKLNFRRACEIFKQVQEHAWYYSLFRRQCYWFCTTFLMRVETDLTVEKTYGRYAKRQGAYRSWVGSIKVLRDNKANMDLEAENMKRGEEARRKKKEAREETRVVVESAMRRKAEEGTAELERTRQAVKAIIDSA